MKIGSIVLSTNQGLGYLARDFYNSGLFDHILIKKSIRFQDNPEWFPGARVIGPRNTDFANVFDKQDVPLIIDFLSKIDILFLFEIPFYNNLYKLCREMGVKVALMPMYESTPFPTEADLYICPSKLDLKYYQEMYPNRKSVFVPVPVPDQISWKSRQKAEVFVHNAGNGGTLGRNSTKEVIEAMKYVKSPMKLILRTQKIDFDPGDPRIDYRKGTEKFSDLYEEGDVFLFPEKFNGLSLPLQESYASGMLVMTSRRFPNTDWLPDAPLIQPSQKEQIRMNGISLEKSLFDPKEIASNIDKWYGKDISKYSLMGREWYNKHSWSSLKEDYLKTLEDLKNEKY